MATLESLKHEVRAASQEATDKVYKQYKAELHAAHRVVLELQKKPLDICMSALRKTAKKYGVILDDEDCIMDCLLLNPSAEIPGLNDAQAAADKISDTIKCDQQVVIDARNTMLSELRMSEPHPTVKDHVHPDTVASIKQQITKMEKSVS
jgi:hypothetical protein